MHILKAFDACVSVCVCACGCVCVCVELNFFTRYFSIVEFSWHKIHMPSASIGGFCCFYMLSFYMCVCSTYMLFHQCFDREFGGQGVYVWGVCIHAYICTQSFVHAQRSRGVRTLITYTHTHELIKYTVNCVNFVLACVYAWMHACACNSIMRQGSLARWLYNWSMRYVQHNLTYVVTLCERVIRLRRGIGS